MIYDWIIDFAVIDPRSTSPKPPPCIRSITIRAPTAADALAMFQVREDLVEPPLLCFGITTMRLGEDATPPDGPWEDQKDEWTDAIAAVHPSRGDTHPLYAIAMRMVGHRHSKAALVHLVHWLLLLNQRREKVIP